MAIECYQRACKFHACYKSLNAEDCEGPLCSLQDCIRRDINTFLLDNVLGRKGPLEFDFFTAEGFVKLLTDCKPLWWWLAFINIQHRALRHSMHQEHVWVDQVFNVDNLPTLIAEFRGWKGPNENLQARQHNILG